jgi:hypothetical protein
MKSTAVKLTDSQKRIQARMLKIAKKRNDKGQGYKLGDGYNANWHKVLDILVERKMLVTKKGKKGLWVK